MNDKTYKVTSSAPNLEGCAAYVEPAGTKKRLGVPFISVLIEITPDSTAEFLMPLDEAIEHGIVEEQEDQT